MKARYFLYLALPLLLGSCLKEKPKAVPVARLDKALESYKDLDDEERYALRDSLDSEITAFFDVMGYPDAGDSEIEWWSHSDEVSVFQPDVDAAYPDLSVLEETLGYIVDNARKDSLPVEGMKFASVVWGKPQPIIVADSVMLIALNHYLGADYPGYSHMHGYRRTEKTAKYLPYDIAAVLAATSTPRFATRQTPTVLNWLLYEGALTEARLRLVPNSNLPDALGYRPDQVEFMQDNLKDIKTEMAQKRMLYDTDPDLIAKLFSAAPSSPLLGGEAPGRAGRFIGHELVCRYLRKHTGVTLQDLLSPEFYDNPNTLLDIGF